jgi:DNA-directed RNA polymerase subunit M/transcription elongation factor TFIIS
MKEYFTNINGGLGLDHWSPSSSDMPLAKWITNYGYHTPQERDQFLMNYKPRIGNLTNNSSQRLLCEFRYFKDKKAKIENRDYNEIYKQELADINKYDPIDEQDKFARDNIDDIAHKIIEQIKKLYKEIFKDEKTAAERYVVNKPKELMHDIIGRIDYESNTKFLELKTKPSKCYKRRNKDEYYWKQQELSEDSIFDGYWKQVAFYWKCTGKKPFLGLANETDYLIFDDTHEKMRADHLEYQYNLMVKKIYRWEQMIIYCKGNLSKLAELTEEPDLNHFFHYKNLTDKQKQTIKQLWGINA